MSEPSSSIPMLDRYTSMQDLTANVSRVLKQSVPWLVAVMGGETAYLFVSDNPGALAFGMISTGAVIAFAVWAGSARGLPLLPMIVVQSLAVYALPIVSKHQDVTRYPADYVTQAGLQVLVLCVALVASWRMAMQIFTPAPPLAYALQGVDREGVAGLSRLGFGLVVAATLFLVLQSLDLTGFIFELLPGGSYPIVRAGIAASSACGFFLLALIVGAGDLPVAPRTFFWLLMIANCLISASGFLLSAAALVLASVVIGLFWSSGRVPWVFILTVAFTVSFFNMGKYEMRGRYWESPDEELARPSGLTGLPTIYLEWTQASWDALTGSESTPTGFNQRDQSRKKPQGLLERLNNLQNVLYVIDAVEAGHIPTLNGKTYTVIPALLVPRILWRSKPRTHEGQVLLNVHFGRQDLQSTFKTYVAWGLPAEAYGNFGPIKGVVFLGVVMGLFFAWAENFTARKPILSTEGFVSFVVFLGLANSFEMVASVLVTSIFQSIVPVVAACAPFVRRKMVVRPETE